jgi:hypothetical protein
MYPVTNRCLTVEVQLTSVGVGSQFLFPDNQIIRGQNIMVYGIETYTASTVANSPSGYTMVTDSGAANLTLNFLDDKSINLVNQLPYQALNSYIMSGVIREFKPFRMVLTKSFVAISSATNLSVNQAILVNILYKPV